jgi:hypothetical protein
MFKLFSFSSFIFNKKRTALVRFLISFLRRTNKVLLKIVYTYLYIIANQNSETFSYQLYESSVLLVSIEKIIHKIKESLLVVLIDQNIVYNHEMYQLVLSNQIDVLYLNHHVDHLVI